MSQALASIAECIIGGMKYLEVKRNFTDEQSDYYQLSEGLYQTLTKFPSSVKYSELLNHLLHVGKRCFLPKEHKATYRVPFLPDDRSHGLVSGFGLTHKNKIPKEKVDSYGQIDGFPSWFFKGFAHSLKLSGESLFLTNTAKLICEEAEIVLIFKIDDTGNPRYLGFTFGNDLTDIGQIRNNSAHLSYGKMTDSAIHPFLFLGEPPMYTEGHVHIRRKDKTVWAGKVSNGLSTLAYDLETIMSKLWQHQSIILPNMMHYVFIGADKNSVDHGCTLSNGDTTNIQFDEFKVKINNTVNLCG
ncbi:hypothetical protein [Zooshikella harenae]|uniref:Sugar transporter n=1 Tax=Zooshikella harenae TaxID=2827238 RepID=A0ABS5ZI67_9GAMM|nr:hypothetical protein [Zooshikella harenae]MBU2713764.1 hypothetical protein [Zooshikella harenae]